MIASLLASKLQAIMSSSGVKARGQSCVSSARLPVVYGEASSEDSGAPTIVIYGHYMMSNRRIRRINGKPHPLNEPTRGVITSTPAALVFSVC